MLKDGCRLYNKMKIVYQVFKKLGITFRWGRGDCRTPNIEIVNDMIKERGVLG